jgi:hypothetical protein
MNSGNDSKEIFSQDFPEEATAAELDLLPKNQNVTRCIQIMVV